MYKRRCDVSDKDFENAADWVRCMDQREDPFFPSFMSDESRRMTDEEFAEHQEWMRGRSVRWMDQAMRGQRFWVLNAGALLIRGEGEVGEIFPKKSWHGVDSITMEIGNFEAETWKIVRCDNAGYGLAVPRGVTNRMRNCDRTARAYCAELRAGDCDSESLLALLRRCWDSICEAEDIMVPDLPDVTLEQAVDDWCEHQAGFNSKWGPNRERWKDSTATP